MRIVIALIAICAAFSNVGMAQEIVIPQDVAQRQQALPDTVLYGVLFRQAATFKDKADELDRQGKDGSPFRNHLAHKLQVTPEEVLSLNTAALQYRTEIADVENEIQQSVARFQEQNSHLVKGQLVPPPPPEAHYLWLKHEDVARRAHDRFHALVGDEEFARIDSLVKEHITKNFHPIQPSQQSVGATGPTQGER